VAISGENVESRARSAETVTKCTKSAKMDLQIIVDSSMSVGQDNFQTMMQKIADDLIDQFNIGKETTRVALYKYSSDAVMIREFGLGKYSDAKTLEARIRETKFMPGWTLTAEAMKNALKYYSKEYRKDKNTAKICIVFTDGQANDAEEIPAATRAWAKAGVKVFAVGIGEGIDRQGLQVIAGDDERVLQVKDFEEIGTMANSLLVKVCKHIRIGCKNGFKLSKEKKRCIKMRPCEISNGGCAQICKNVGSKAKCACKDGFKLFQHKKCVKVHPCDLKSKGGCAQICNKDGAAFNCNCKEGFKLATDKKRCIAVHPCDINRGGCNYKCLKIGDQAVCTCQNGYKLSGNRKTCQRISNCKWFCAVTQNRGVVARTTNLQDAQRHLGGGNKNNRQAIIPMTDRRAGDPHTLPKGWGRGSMWWWDWWDINQMRDKCARQQPVCKVHPCDGHTRGGCNQLCNKSGDQARCSCVSGYHLSGNQKTCVKVTG